MSKRIKSAVPKSNNSIEVTEVVNDEIVKYEASLVRAAEMLRECHLARINAERKRDFATVAVARQSWQAIRKAVSLTSAEAAMLTKKSAQRTK